MVICYSEKSAPSAKEIEYVSGGDIIAKRRNTGSINWGRARADTELNPDISNSTNKRVMRELFREHGVPMPKLIVSPPYPFPIVGRPDHHMKGRGLWICHSLADVRRALRGTRKKKAATHFMEYIDMPREYRVHILNGKSIRISEKRFGETGATSYGDYVTVKPNPEHNIKHIRRAAKQAVKALGLDFGAVDILADNENCFVLEVNAAPGLGGSLPRLYANAFKEWYDKQ